MIWPEIKKSINSNLQKPLNEQIESYLMEFVKAPQKNTLCDKATISFGTTDYDSNLISVSGSGYLINMHSYLTSRAGYQKFTFKIDDEKYCEIDYGNSTSTTSSSIGLNILSLEYCYIYNGYTIFIYPTGNVAVDTSNHRPSSNFIKRGDILTADSNSKKYTLFHPNLLRFESSFSLHLTATSPSTGGSATLTYWYMLDE